MAAAAPVDRAGELDALVAPPAADVAPEPADRLALVVLVLVLVLKFPAADVPAITLELLTGTSVVLRPAGMPGAEDT